MANREHILGLTKQTDNKFLNMYAADAVDNNGDGFEYYFATRREDGDLMCQTGELKADGIVIYVQTVDARSQVAVGKSSTGEFVTPEPIDPDDPTKGGIAKVVLTELDPESSGKTTAKLYIKRAEHRISG